MGSGCSRLASWLWVGGVQSVSLHVRIGGRDEALHHVGNFNQFETVACHLISLSEKGKYLTHLLVMLLRGSSNECYSEVEALASDQDVGELKCSAPLEEQTWHFRKLELLLDEESMGSLGFSHFRSRHLKACCPLLAVGPRRHYPLLLDLLSSVRLQESIGLQESIELRGDFLQFLIVMLWLFLD